MDVNRGDVVLVDFPYPSGTGSKVRPALVIQNDRGNEFSATTIVAAVTTRIRRAYPFQVEVSALEGGLPHASTVLLDQLQTIDQDRLQERIGALEPDRMIDIDRALLRSLGIDR